MKTSELKKRVEDMGYDLSYDRFNDNLYIHTQNINERIGYIYLTKQYYFGFNDLSLVTDEIFDLLAEYAKTPIDEREEPKMYTARSKVVINNGGFLNKLRDSGSYTLSDADNFHSHQTHFTQKELENINGINIFTSDEWIVEEVDE